MGYSKLNDPIGKCKSMQITSAGALTAGECIVKGTMLLYLNSGATAASEEVTAIYETGSRGLTLPKQAGLAITQGDAVYYDTAAKEVDTTSTNEDLGHCLKDAASGDTTVEVSLFQKPIV